MIVLVAESGGGRLAEALRRCGHEPRDADERSLIETLLGGAAVHAIVLADSPPWLDAVRVFRHLRAAWPHLPVVLASDGAHAARDAAFLRAGGDVIVPLVAADDLLQAALERAVASARQRGGGNLADAVFETVTSGIVITSADGTIRRINPAACRLFGYSPPDVIGRNVAVLVPTRDAAGGTGPCRNHQVLARRSTGETFPLELKVSEVGTPAGTQYLGVCTDVTPCVLLRESEERFRAIVEGDSLFGTVMIERDAAGLARFTFATTKMTEILGRSRADIEGQLAVTDVVVPEDRPLVAELLHQAFRGTPQGHPAAFRIRRPDGGVVRVRAHLAGSHCRGTPVAVGIVQRASEAQEAEERARRAERAQAEAERACIARADFLASVNHELRTPLTAIVGFAEQAEMELADGQRDRLQRHLARIVANADRLAGVIGGVLDLSKIESNEQPANMLRHALATLARGAIADLAPLALRRGLTMRLTDTLGPDHRTACDGKLIGRLMVNLLSNAIKFADPGSEIGIRLWADGDAVCCEVADHGIDIPGDELERIFEPFAQSSRTRGHHGGTGLGLTLCRRIVTLHGGRIWARSSVDAGVAMTFRLPAHPPATLLPVATMEDVQ